MKPRLVPSRLRCASITATWCELISGTIIGTSGVQRCAELFETSGVSARAYASSSFAVSSFAMSTAQNTKSTWLAIEATSDALPTGSFAVAFGTGVGIVQRPVTASPYDLPAELGLAATVVTSNHG